MVMPTIGDKPLVGKWFVFDDLRIVETIGFQRPSVVFSCLNSVYFISTLWPMVGGIKLVRIGIEKQSLRISKTTSYFAGFS